MSVTKGTFFSNSDIFVTNVTVASVVLASGDVADVTVTWREQAAETMSSVTFNGTSTGVTQTAISSGNGERVGIAKYRIVGRTGTASVVATLTATVDSMRVDIQVLQGVDNTTPCGTVDTDVDLGAELGALSGTVTLASGDLAIDAAVVLNDVVSTMAMNSGQATIQAPVATGASSHTSGVSSEGGSGSVTSGYTWNGAVGTYARNILVPYLQAPPSGTAVIDPALATEAEIVAGGKVFTLTLTNDTFITN